MPEGTLLLCPECGQLLSQASDDAYNEAMKRWDNTEKVSKNPRIHHKRLNYILKHWESRPEDTRLLDIGSSFGMFLKVASQNGFNVEGIEPSRVASEHSIKEGFKVHVGYLESLHLQDNSYDILTLFEVIEHIKSPMPLLKECHRILRHDGLFVLSTPNTDSWTCKYLKNKWTNLGIAEAGHISLFNPKSLSLAASRAGFKTVRLYTRGVKLASDDEKNRLRCSLYKIASELLALPAKLLTKGLDAILILRK